MTKYDLGDLRQWRVISPADCREIDGGVGRNLRLLFMFQGFMAVIATEIETGEQMLLGVGSGAVECKFRIVGTWSIKIEGKGDAYIFDPDFNQLVERAFDEKLTSIERRRERNPAFDRMMAQVRYNEQARNAKLDAEIANMREQLNVANSQLAAQAPPKPVPAKAGKGIARKGAVKPTE